jgi:galactose mutarotase-like enzyme
MSPDFETSGDAGVHYTLTDRNELRIDMRATTDRPTPINLVHHSYWNRRLPGNPGLSERDQPPGWRAQVILRPGQRYRHTMVHAFAAGK